MKGKKKLCLGTHLNILPTKLFQQHKYQKMGAETCTNDLHSSKRRTPFQQLIKLFKKFPFQFTDEFYIKLRKTVSDATHK